MNIVPIRTVSEKTKVNLNKNNLPCLYTPPQCNIIKKASYFKQPTYLKRVSTDANKILNKISLFKATEKLLFSDNFYSAYETVGKMMTTLMAGAVDLSLTVPLTYTACAVKNLFK